MSSMKLGCFPNYSLYLQATDPRTLAGIDFETNGTSVAGTGSSSTDNLSSIDIHTPWYSQWRMDSSTKSSVVLHTDIVFQDVVLAPDNRLVDIPDFDCLALVGTNFVRNSQVRVVCTSGTGPFQSRKSVDSGLSLSFVNSSGNASGNSGDIDEAYYSPDSTYVHLETDDEVTADMVWASTSCTETDYQLIVAIINVNSEQAKLTFSIETDVSSKTTIGSPMYILQGTSLPVMVPFTMPAGAGRLAVSILVEDIGTIPADVDVDLINWLQDNSGTSYMPSYDSGWLSANSIYLPSTHKADFLSFNDISPTFVHFFSSTQTNIDRCRVMIRNWNSDDGGAHSHPDTVNIGHFAFGPSVDVSTLVGLSVSVIDNTKTDKSYSGNDFFDPRNTKRQFSASLELPFEDSIQYFLNGLFRLQGKAVPLIVSFLTDQSTYTEALSACSPEPGK